MPLILHGAGMRVETYASRFSNPKEPDSEWLAIVSQAGLITLSHDRKFLWDPLAKRAVMENGGRVFILRGQCSHALLGEMVVRARNRMEKIIAKQSEPFIAVVRRVMTDKDPTRIEIDVKLTRAMWLAGYSGEPDPDDEPELPLADK